jgi:ABC-2 type transport system ATP-binding protein
MLQFAAFKRIPGMMIVAENLTRTFGMFRKKTAVDRVSFEVNRGEVYGFLGHNGAGKTTTVRMLTGQLQPSSGRGEVAGFDIVQQRSQIHPLIGVVFEQQNLYPKMSGLENLRFFADLFGVPLLRADELLELVGLSKRARDKVKTYSNGMKQRLLIARALLNHPRVLFLDEPSRGLDPTSAREVRGVVQDLASQGTTVFLTTHIMEEADMLCDRVAFIKEGRLVASDSPARLKLAYGHKRARVLLRPENGGVGESAAVEISIEEPEDAAMLAKWIEQGRVETIHSQEASLEEVFVQLAGKAEE